MVVLVSGAGQWWRHRAWREQGQLEAHMRRPGGVEEGTEGRGHPLEHLSRGAYGSSHRHAPFSVVSVDTVCVCVCVCVCGVRV